MAIEINSVRAVCSKCGTDYSRQKGYFPVSYAVLHKGVGHTHVCKDCIDSIYNGYLAQCNNAHDAVRQVCRKLDLYWSENAYSLVERKSTTRSMMTQYIAKINTVTYAGKSYDDTLLEEGTLWNFGQNVVNAHNETPESIAEDSGEVSDVIDIEIPEEVIAFWGPGYNPEMYEALEQRRSYWMSRLPNGMDIDIGTEAIIRQICSLELDINRDRAAGRPVDKSIAALNTLLGSASLKPTQKKGDADASVYNTPMGVWIDRFEYKRPIPDDVTDEEKNYFKKYILAWFGGHLSKMFGIKNANTKLYDEEIAKYRVCRPEFDDDSDDDMMYDILSDAECDTDDLLTTGGDGIDDEG